ncbi:MAG: hypothetical protein PSX79_14415 [bacterium]|nr:hypothetical protein [bacterium]
MLSAAPVLAQTAPEGRSTADTVVVNAANRNRVLNYVKAASALSVDRQVSRRAGSLCPLVAGAPREVNTYVTARLRQVGEQVGVEFERKPCQPNLLVLFSREPEVMLRQARDQRKINARFSTPQARRFMSEPRPVRWLNNVGVTAAEGRTASASNSIIVSGVDSRLSNPTRSLILGSVIVVDANRTQGVEVGALADYVALTALADIKPDANLAGHRSILNLFSDGQPAASRLTPIDMAYLRGVYKARDTASGANQMGKVATIMAEDLER